MPTDAPASWARPGRRDAQRLPVQLERWGAPHRPGRPSSPRPYRSFRHPSAHRPRVARRCDRTSGPHPPSGPERSVRKPARRTAFQSGAPPCVPSHNSPGSPCISWTPRRGETAGTPTRRYAHRKRRPSSRSEASTNARRCSRHGTRPSSSAKDHRPSTVPRARRTGRGRTRTGGSGRPCVHPRRPTDAASSWPGRSCTRTGRSPRSRRTTRRKGPSSCPSTGPSSFAWPRTCAHDRSRTQGSRRRSGFRNRYPTRLPRRRS